MALDPRLETIERAVRFNSRLTTALLLLLVALVVGTGAFAYWKIRPFLYPETLVTRAEQQIEARYPEVKAELKKAVAEKGPEVARKLSQRARGGIPETRARIERYLDRKMDTGLDRASALSAKQFQQFLRDNRPLLKEGFTELRETTGETRKFVAELEKRAEKSFGTDLQTQARRVLDFLRSFRSRLERFAQEPSSLPPAGQVEYQIVRLLRALQLEQEK